MAAAHLRLRGTVWWFRRRVPLPLIARFRGVEINASLQTSAPRIADLRARAFFVATEQAFRDVSDSPRLTPTEAHALVARWLRETLAGLENQRAQGKDYVDALVCGITDPEVVALSKTAEAQNLAVGVMAAFHRPELMGKVTYLPQAVASEIAEKAGIPFDFDSPEGKLLARITSRALAELSAEMGRRLNGEFPPMRYEELALPSNGGHDRSLMAGPVAPTQVPVREMPLFSALIDEFLREKCLSSGEHKGYSQQTALQTRATCRLWLELVGDRPVFSYTGAEAGKFRSELLRLPSSYGKSSTVITAPEAIKQADLKGSPRLSMKTVKRHFSTLSQFWVWMTPRELVDKNIFRGFVSPGTCSSRKSRDDWSVADLNSLFASSWYGPKVDRISARWWLPMIAMHSGMRLEDIARLRSEEDLEVIAGVPVMKLQNHSDGWSPKSEAGERIVPIHSRLLEMGLWSLVEERRATGSFRLFPDLRPAGPDLKYGFEFSREFSRQKILNKIGSKTVFHSFRHSARTILTNTDLKEEWIDAVMGHEGENNSQGITTYLKRIGIQNLKAVIEGIEYSSEVKLPNHSVPLAPGILVQAEKLSVQR